MQPIEYIDVSSPLHRMDPRTKLLVFVTLTTYLVCFEHPLWALLPAAMVVVIVRVAKVQRNVYRLRFLLLMLSVSGLVLWTLFTQGETPLVGPIAVESIMYASSRVLLIAATIMAGVVFVSTTRTEELVFGLVKLGVPYRVGFAISTALRLAPLMILNTVTITQAQRSRGLDLETGNALTRVRKFVPVLVPVFVSSIRHIDTLSMALEARGFGFLPTRESFLELHLRPIDYVVGGLAVIALVGIVILRLKGYGQIVGLRS